MSDAEPKPGMGAVAADKADWTQLTSQAAADFGQGASACPGSARTSTHVLPEQRAGGFRRLGSEQVVLSGRGGGAGPGQRYLRPYGKRWRRSCWTPALLNTFSGGRRLPEIKVEVRPGGCLGIVRSRHHQAHTASRRALFRGRIFPFPGQARSQHLVWTVTGVPVWDRVSGVRLTGLSFRCSSRAPLKPDYFSRSPDGDSPVGIAGNGPHRVWQGKRLLHSSRV
jgi:hypothetical protein